MQKKLEEEAEVFTNDRSVDWRGRRAVKAKSGTWIAGIIILCEFYIYIYTQTKYSYYNNNY